MIKKCRLRITRNHFDRLHQQLFPGDRKEHGAVVLAGLSLDCEALTLYVREVHAAEEGTDYVEGKIGYRALAPEFIHRLITRARDERLVYLAVHNHPVDQEVAFSRIDLDSHERGYPALLQISGLPVGALVFGQRSVQADVWQPAGPRLNISAFTVVGNTIRHFIPSSDCRVVVDDETYDRQVRIFGEIGQDRLSNSHVGIIGLGGIGSLVAEYLSRLGVGKITLVDDDVVEESNLSRIVGATINDAIQQTTKVSVAARLTRLASSRVTVKTINGDVALESVAKTLTSCDYLFLAADSMRARLVFNALVHQYLIPGVQLGSKVRSGRDGDLLDVMSANRPVRPGIGCLWCNQLIDSNQLAREAKTDDERKAQAYGTEEPNPSVISLNAIAAAHAVNDFLFDYLELRSDNEKLYYEHFHFLQNRRVLVVPRRDEVCPECSPTGKRFGMGDSVELPCIESTAPDASPRM